MTPQSVMLGTYPLSVRACAVADLIGNEAMQNTILGYPPRWIHTSAELDRLITVGLAL